MKQTFRELLELHEAQENGATIQGRICFGDEWEDINNARFNSPTLEYRIKPETKIAKEFYISVYDNDGKIEAERFSTYEAYGSKDLPNKPKPHLNKHIYKVTLVEYE